MPLADIREQVKAILSGVSGAGVVHDYERWASTWEKFLDLFKDEATGKINGWTLTREKTPKRQATVGEKERAHVFVLRKYQGLRDEEATELTFQDHLEDTVAAFDDNETLNDTCLTINPDWGPMAGAVGLQIDIVELRMFGSVLCHYGECRLGIVETVEDS